MFIYEMSMPQRSICDFLKFLTLHGTALMGRVHSVLELVARYSLNWIDTCRRTTGAWLGAPVCIQHDLTVHEILSVERPQISPSSRTSPSFSLYFLSALVLIPLLLHGTCLNEPCVQYPACSTLYFQGKSHNAWRPWDSHSGLQWSCLQLTWGFAACPPGDSIYSGCPMVLYRE